MLISLGTDATDAYPKRIETTWNELTQWLSIHPRPTASLSVAEYASATKERIHADKSGPYIVLADFGGRRRSLDTLLVSYGVPLDFDDGRVTLDVIQTVLRGYTCYAYTTYAHQPSAQRWRVLVPTAQPMDAATHRATWHALSAMFGGAADPAAKDASRLSYLPGRCLVPEAAQWYVSTGTLFTPVSAPAPATVLTQSSNGPVAGWSGPTDDDALIHAACTTRKRTDERLGGPVHFAMLWSANAEWLAQRFPGSNGQPWDMTQADMALAGELIHWTGGDVDRSIALMLRSGLARDDEDWQSRKVPRAVERAAESCKQYAFMVPPPPPPPAPSTGGVEGDQPRATSKVSDQSNVDRMRDHFGDKLLASSGSFYVWDGRRWELNDSRVRHFACRLSRLVYAEADHARMQINQLQPPGTLVDEAKGAELDALDRLAEALDKWAVKCESKSTQDAAIGMYRDYANVPVKELDTDRMLLNVQNGTIDLCTGQIRPHEPRERITKLAPVTYDVNARAPTFLAFLSSIFQADQSIIAFMQRWFGYCATGHVREEKLVIHWGEGSNGKSTLLNLLRVMLGDYAGVASSELVSGRDGSDAARYLAELQGRRLMTASELEEGAPLKESSIKTMTGGDSEGIKGRRLYKDLFTFEPTHKIQLVSNAKPVIRGTDYAIWRRVLFVPYLVRFGGPAALASGEATAPADPLLPERLRAEMPGILNWLIQGSLEWQRVGLDPPAAIQAASSAYRGEQDRIGEFLSDRCEMRADGRVGLRELYVVYQGWCRESGYQAFGKHRFSGELDRKLPADARYLGHNNTAAFRGLAIKPTIK